MSTELRLPQLADTVTSVKLAAWLKAEGEAVVAGEPLVEVETDKTNVEIEAPASGVLETIHVPAGSEGLETGALLAVITEDAVAPAATGAAASEAQPASDAAAPVPRESAPDAPAAAARAAEPAASPLARRMAAAAGLDLARISGTGRGGRISKADVERALAPGAAPAAAAPSASQPAAGDAAPPPDAPMPGGRDEPLSALRRVTAERPAGGQADPFRTSI